MALKTTYKATRGDARHLIRNVKPGDILYVVHDIADRYVMGKGGYEDPQLYSIHIVTADRGWPSGDPMVCSSASTSGSGTESIKGLLGRAREIHTQPPAGIQHIGSMRADLVSAKQLAAHVTRLHAKEVAAARKEPVGAGAAKKGWF